MDKHDSINPRPSHDVDDLPGEVAAVASRGQTVFLETTKMLNSAQMDVVRDRLDSVEKRTGVHLVLMQGVRVARITIPAASE